MRIFTPRITTARIAAALLCLTVTGACTDAPDDEDAPSAASSAPADPSEQGELYMVVDLPEATAATDPASRLSYDYSYIFYEWGEGNLTARWQRGDIIKVYETTGGGFTDVYADYEAYATKFPYPLAPITDTYYRFECVGGEGTAHGIFRYVGLTTAVVVAGKDGYYNVNLDIVYNHKIPDWEKFQGLAIYGNPLRNYMMRHQAENRSTTHIKYGERMKGHVCGYNFDSWFSDASHSTQGAGLSGLLLYNTSGCIYRIILGGFEDDIYGGADLSLTIPGVTTGYPEGDIRNNPMTLTLGNHYDHQERQDPWCVANPGCRNAHVQGNTIVAYIVGWPGTLQSGNEAVVTFHDNFFGKAYTWRLKRSDSVTFKEANYYTFDLRDDTPVVTTFTPTPDPEF